MAATDCGLQTSVRTFMFGLALVGCAPEVRDGEGLYIADAGAPVGLIRAQDPATAGGAGGSTTGGDMLGGGEQATTGQPMTGQPGRACVSLNLFTSSVAPVFTKDCVRCHDGTKGKATQLLNLTSLRTSGFQMACDATLVTTDDVNPAASRILTFVNPDDPSTTHDFKYATSAEFATYRDTVLAWLAAE